MNDRSMVHRNKAHRTAEAVEVVSSDAARKAGPQFLIALYEIERQKKKNGDPEIEREKEKGERERERVGCHQR